MADVIFKHNLPFIGTGGKLLRKRLNYTPIHFGMYYNYYALTNSKNLAAPGWHIMTKDEYLYFIGYILGTTVGVNDTSFTDNRITYGMRRMGSTYWTSATGTDLYNVKFPGSGYRGGIESSGTFYGFRGQICLSTPSLNYNGAAASGFQVFNQNNTCQFTSKSGYGSQFEFSAGYSAAVVKDSTTLVNGETGIYVDNVGLTYQSICIGTKEYVFAIAERKYRDGSMVPFHGAGADFYTNAEWVALGASDACCPPNGDWNNV